MNAVDEMSAAEGMPGSSRGLTELLLSWGGGNDAAREALLPLVYDDLRQIARGYLRRERPGHTLHDPAPELDSRREPLDLG